MPVESSRVGSAPRSPPLAAMGEPDAKEWNSSAKSGYGSSVKAGARQAGPASPTVVPTNVAPATTPATKQRSASNKQSRIVVNCSFFSNRPRCLYSGADLWGPMPKAVAFQRLSTASLDRSSGHARCRTPLGGGPRRHPPCRRSRSESHRTDRSRATRRSRPRARSQAGIRKPDRHLPASPWAGPRLGVPVIEVGR